MGSEEFSPFFVFFRFSLFFFAFLRFSLFFLVFLRFSLVLSEDKGQRRQFTAKMGNFTLTPSAPTPCKASRFFCSWISQWHGHTYLWFVSHVWIHIQRLYAQDRKTSFRDPSAPVAAIPWLSQDRYLHFSVILKDSSFLWENTGICLGAKKSTQTFFCTMFFDNPLGHGRPRRKSWTSAPKSAFSCGPGGGEKFLTPGHPDVRGKSGAKSLCLCCFFFPDMHL